MRFAGKIFALLVAIVLVCATASWAAQGGQGATAPRKTKEVGSKKAEGKAGGKETAPGKTKEADTKKAEGKAIGKDTAPGLPKAEAKREASAAKKVDKAVKKDAKADAKETKKDMKADAKETKNMNQAKTNSLLKYRFVGALLFDRILVFETLGALAS